MLSTVNELNKDSTRILNNLYWGKCLKDGSSLNLRLNKEIISRLTDSFGELSIPISQQDLEKIKKTTFEADCPDLLSEKQMMGEKTMVNVPSTFQISLKDAATGLHRDTVGLKILVVSALEQVQAVHYVSSLVEDQVKVSCVLLNQLILCTTGGCFSIQNNSAPNKITGSFGKLVLQLPVEGGYEGGSLKVDNSDGTTTVCDSSNQSHKYLYCSIFFSGCKYEWWPVNNGNMVLLHCDLNLQPESALPSDRALSKNNLISFLSATNSIKTLLRIWTILEQERSSPLKEKNKLRKNNFLIFPLKEKIPHHEKDFELSTLSGNDLALFHILRLIDFIDVQLTIVDLKDTTVQTVKWITSNVGIPQSQHYCLDFNNHLMGSFLEPFLCSDDSTTLARHPAIVIQPLIQSIWRSCIERYEFLIK